MSEPRWLTAAEQRAWRAYVEGGQRLKQRLGEDLAGHGLSLMEYEVLVALSESPGRQRRMADLAGDCLQSRSRLTHTIERLERSGWVRREACPGDGRGVLAILTDEGMATLDAAAVTHAGGVRDFLIDLADPDDFQAVGRVFGAVAEKLRPEAAHRLADLPAGLGDRC